MQKGRPPFFPGPTKFGSAPWGNIMLILSLFEHREHFLSSYQNYQTSPQIVHFKGIVSPDWKGLHMFSLDRFEV
jgi:hypothetical protein